MALRVRRVVTGHDAYGRSIVQLDETSPNVVSNRPESSSCVVWSTTGFPVDNADAVDPTSTPVAKVVEDGTIFRVVRYEPGGQPRMHRTESIDYAVVLSGEIELILDEGSVHLHAGDLVVQRGTMHGWRNRGPEPCEIAFILISAEAVESDGRSLTNEGW